MVVDLKTAISLACTEIITVCDEGEIQSALLAAQCQQFPYLHEWRNALIHAFNGYVQLKKKAEDIQTMVRKLRNGEPSQAVPSQSA